MVFGQDIAVLRGFVFALIAASPTVITGNPLDDALGTITIGVLLIMSAIVIGVEIQDMMIRIGDQWLSRTNCKPNGLILDSGLINTTSQPMNS